MRKVIRGRVFDTGTACKVGYWWNGWGGRDYRSETLYRKRNGEYFLHVEVGEFDISEHISPVGYDLAREWAERSLDADEYEAEFGTPDEGSEHDLHVIVSESAWQALSRAASSGGTSVRAVVERLASTL